MHVVGETAVEKRTDEQRIRSQTTETSKAIKRGTIRKSEINEYQHKLIDVFLFLCKSSVGNQ